MFAHEQDGNSGRQAAERRRSDVGLGGKSRVRGRGGNLVPYSRVGEPCLLEQLLEEELQIFGWLAVEAGKAYQADGLRHLVYFAVIEGPSQFKNLGLEAISTGENVTVSGRFTNLQSGQYHEPRPSKVCISNC